MKDIDAFYFLLPSLISTTGHQHTFEFSSSSSRKYEEGSYDCIRISHCNNNSSLFFGNKLEINCFLFQLHEMIVNLKDVKNFTSCRPQSQLSFLRPQQDLVGTGVIFA